MIECGTFALWAGSNRATVAGLHVVAMAQAGLHPVLMDVNPDTLSLSGEFNSSFRILCLEILPARRLYT